MDGILHFAKYHLFVLVFQIANKSQTAMDRRRELLIASIFYPDFILIKFTKLTNISLMKLSI